MSNCVIISVTENGIVASIIVLPKGGKGDTTQHSGIYGGSEGTVPEVLEEDEDKDAG
jgi:hypothetical protein